MNHRDNNLNLLRLIASFMVLYSHAFAFYGKKSHRFLDFNSFGGLGISIFFIISGYLIVKSWDSDPVWYRFLLKRSLRIFPGLIVVVLLTAMIVGPLFSSLNVTDYFAHDGVIFYLKNILLYPVFALPGVLVDARVPNAINGSLWSLPVEYSLYLTVLLIGLIFKGTKILYLSLLVIFILVNILWVWQGAEMLVFYGSDVRQYFIAGIFFIIGACYAKFNVNRFFSLTTSITCLFLLTFFSGTAEVSKLLMWIFFPFVVLSFGLSTSWLGSKINALGDYSYGVYIYAFPVQQLLLLKFPEIGFYSYLLYSSVITLFFAAISWHLIEKKCLAIKPITAKVN